MRMGWVIAACVPLAAPLAQAPAPPTAAQQALRFAHELELPKRRVEAVDALLLLGADAVPALMQQAKHPDLATARVALEIVAALSHDGLAAVPALKELAKGNDLHAQAAAWTLARLPHRGTFLVPVMQQGVVLELDGQGKEIWRSPKVGGVWAASMLANGHLLVAETTGGAREYDANGKVVFEVANDFAYAAERLIDGNTLVSAYRKRCVIELDATGNEVWSHNDVFALFATRLPNGRTLLADYQRGRMIEVDRAGDVVWQLDECQQAFSCHRQRDGSTWALLQQQRQARLFARDGRQLGAAELEEGSSSFVPLPDGSIQSGNGFVRRCDAKGKELWRTKIDGHAGRITLR